MSLPRGLVQVYTGDGKGKTTAALGLAVRALGQGLNVCFLQFLKGGPETGEQRARALLPAMRWETFGLDRRATAKVRDWWLQGWTEADQAAAQEGLAVAKGIVLSGEYDLVVLDELCVALQGGLVPLSQVLELLEARPGHVEVVITGRGAPPALLERADLVTEMREVKHPYRGGIPARRGIEY
jgi:cob(I)alamin adenosyltransferase